MFNENRRRGARRPNTTQKPWDEKTALPFNAPDPIGQIWFHPVDAATQSAFFTNLKNRITNEFKFDPSFFKDVALQAPTTSINGGSEIPVLTVDHLRKCLKAGETLFTGYEPDGDPRGCGLCWVEFQLHKRNSFQRDNGGVTFVGGDIAIVKKAVLQEFVAGLRKEYAAKLVVYQADLAKWQSEQPAGGAPVSKFLDLSAKPQAPADPAEMIGRLSGAVEATMAEFVGDGKAPELTVAMPVGFTCGCQKLLYATYVARESVLAALAYVDKRIGSSEDREETARMLESVGARRPQRDNRQHTSGASDNRGRRDNGRPTPTEFESVNWHGAKIQRRTAEALTKAGFNNLTDAITAAETGELEKKGIANERSIGPITDALQRAKEGTANPTFVGRGSTAPGAVPGDSKPAAKQTGGKRPAARNKELSAPRRRNDPTVDGGPVGLAGLRS